MNSEQIEIGKYLESMRNLQMIFNGIWNNLGRIIDGIRMVLLYIHWESFRREIGWIRQSSLIESKGILDLGWN